MAKQQQKEELPLMDDFTEESLFDQLEEEDEGADGSGNENDDDDDDEAKGKAGASSEEDDEDDDSSGSKKDEEDDEEDDDDDESKPKPKSKAKSEEDDDEDGKEGDDDDDSGETFWTDVEKLTGRSIDVDYGDTNPESPEGAAIREEALVQGAINDHLDTWQKSTLVSSVL